MATVPEYAAWTARGVEMRLLEAAETLMLCPHVNGPKAFGSSMPDPLRLAIDAYASNTRRYRRKPDAAAIDRMEECWMWINGLPEPATRRIIYDWTRIKCSNRRSLKLFAVSNGLTERTLRRAVVRICESIAERLNEAHAPNLADGALASVKEAPKEQFNVSYQHHWRAANARPQIDPQLKKSRLV